MTRMNDISAPEDTSFNGIVMAVLDFIGNIPTTDEVESANPIERARSITRTAAAKAAGVSGTLSLPPGPAGWLTILPDLMAVWRIQAQMIADIAGAFGKQAYLTQEQMMFCLFRHAAAQAVRDLVVRVGERILIRRVSLPTLQSITRKIGVRLTQRIIGRSV